VTKLKKLHLGEVMPENSQAGFDSAIIQETNAIDSKIKHWFLLTQPVAFL